MENRMRDLDQIQERDGDDRGRKLGTVLLATASVVGLTFAMGVVVGRAAEPTEAKPKDPLDQLVPGGAPGEAAEEAAPAPTPVPKVEPTELSFPSTLTEEEDRPEVLAALRAAALEEAALAQPAAGPAAAAPASAVAAAIDVPEAQGIRFSDPVDDEELAAPQELVAAVPAAVAAGSTGETLHHSAQHDPMVAQALRADDDAPKGPRAPRGMDGEYTLQVISYDSSSQANAFADGLREKGHEAFVVKADIPDRGRFYRVRIGPFKNRHKAEVYRRKFEQEERMNTFVVRKRPDA
jgi:cell division septation protein DedD